MSLDSPVRHGVLSGVGPLRQTPPVGAVPLRQQIFESVRAAGRISRASLAKDLQVSPGSVTPLVSDLIQTGLLQELEGDTAHSGRGRPPVTLGVVPEAAYVIGIKLSDLANSAILVDLAGQPVEEVFLPNPQSDRRADTLVALTAKLVTKLLAKTSIAAGRIAGFGLGLPGMVDQSRGMVRWSPMLDGQNVPLAQLLSDRLAKPVVIENDANCMTMAELWFGRGRSLPDFAVVTIEDGVGMGLVLNHQPWRGSHGFGMELAHTKIQLDGALCRCGQRGCLEAYVADYALAREAAVALDGPLPPRDAVLAELSVQAKAGNASARAIFERAGKVLALGLANVVNLFDPPRIILSGSGMRYDLLWPPEMLAEMSSRVLLDPPEVEVSAWDDLVWARGAAALALAATTPAILG